MNIKFFNKDFKEMKLSEKMAAILLIPVVIVLALGITLFRKTQKNKN
jgi:hypothetical protein